MDLSQNFGLTPIQYSAGGPRQFAAPDQTQLLAQLMARRQQGWTPLSSVAPVGVGAYQGWQGLQKYNKDAKAGEDPEDTSARKNAGIAQMASGALGAATSFAPQRYQGIGAMLATLANEYSKRQDASSKGNVMRRILESDDPKRLEKGYIKMLLDQQKESE